MENKIALGMIGTLAIGFIGGLVASLFIFGLNRFPDDILSHGHPLISAPFLGFLAAIIIIFLFHAPIQMLLSKGQLTVKWGDKEISIAEIEQNLDEQFHQYEAKLSDLQAEINQVREKIENGTQPSTRSTQTNNNKNELHRIKQELEWVQSDNMALLVYHLGTSKFKWRNQSTIAQKTSLHPDDIDTLVKSVPEHIIRSKGKSGNIIYRLSDKDSGTFLQYKDQYSVTEES